MLGHREGPIQNYPIKLNFAGLRGDTYAMQRYGWEFSVSDHSYGDPEPMYSVAGRHKGLHLYIMSAAFRLCRYSNEPMHRQLQNIEVDIKACAEAMQIIMPLPVHATSFSSVDFNERSYMHPELDKWFDIEDLIPFKPTNSEAELYIPEKELWTTQKHLEAIKSLQMPFQKELREKKRKDTARDMASSSKDINIQGTNEVVFKLITVA